MRGQGLKQSQNQSRPGITPADAGTSTRSLSPEPRTKDHPRGCGDKFSNRLFRISKSGSPPRMRGQAPWSVRDSVPQRITPADAGTRLNRAGSCVYPKDHPRGCGDKEPAGLHGNRDGGSPPRMRGQVNQGSVGYFRRWITPADAGTRDPPVGQHAGCEDHPRGCGDKSK